jgi:hypothetical protein
MKWKNLLTVLINMKNSEIHKGLEKKEIRDFLSLTLVRYMEEQFKNSNLDYVPHNDDPFEYSIQRSERDIKFHMKQIEICKGLQAASQLIKMNGWEEFDVSDETVNDSTHQLKLSFIGTKKEYDFLLLQINGN